MEQVTRYAPQWHEGWHELGRLLYDIVDLGRQPPPGLVQGSLAEVFEEKVGLGLESHFLEMVTHAFRTLFKCLAQDSTAQRASLHDQLKLLILWFQYGDIPDVAVEIERGTMALDPSIWR
jgi:hypothetical protein